MDTLYLADPVEPPAPDPGDQVAFERWKYVYKEYMIKMQEYMNFRSDLYNLVMGLCTEALKEHLISHEDFVGANQNGNALLVLIRSLLHTFEEHHKLADGLSDMKMGFYKLRQGKYMKLECYHEIFLAQVEVLDEVGITIADTALVQHIAEQHGRGVPVENLNQARSDRRTVELRFSWEGVLNHTWISPWTQKGILLCEMDPRNRSVTYVFMNDETSV